MSFTKDFQFFVCFLLACLTAVHSTAIRVNDIDLQKSGELVFAHVFYRHGDRNAIGQNPGDKYDISYWPEGWGQLTKLGKQQHFELGKWFRNRYRSFLNTTFNVDDIYVQSSDVDRTLMSAQANLAGLYPSKGDQIWNNNLQWQPIPIHSMPVSMDYLIAGGVPTTCTAYQNAYNAYIASDEMTRYGATVKPFYDYLTEKTGTTIDSYMTLLLIRDSWLCESVHNLRLPEWAKPLYPNNEKFNQAALKFYALSTSTKFLAKFTSGFLLKIILDRFKSKTQNTLSPNRKLCMYSTHDSTLFSFLNSLGVSDNNFVPYTATIILELRRYQNDYYVQIFYKNSDKTPDPLKIPGCGISCPLSKLYQIYDDILPKNDFDTECQNNV